MSVSNQNTQQKQQQNSDTHSNGSDVMIVDCIDNENNNSYQNANHITEQSFPSFPRTKSSTPFKKNKSVPAIFVNSEVCNQQQLLNLVTSANINMNAMKFFPSANNQIRIDINEIEVYDKVHQLPMQNEIVLHTHAVKSRVKPVYIIKNLCRNFDLEEIEADLNDQNFGVIVISLCETKFHV